MQTTQLLKRQTLYHVICHLSSGLIKPSECAHTSKKLKKLQQFGLSLMRMTTNKQAHNI